MPRGGMPVVLNGSGLKGLNLLGIYAIQQEPVEGGLNFLS